MASKNRGTCQCCGSIQKLPSGRLSVHGYTVEWGFFNGTCRGAHELPFEQSKGLVEKFISDAVQEIPQIVEDRAMLQAPATDTTKAWFRVTMSAARGRSYQWKLGSVTREDKTFSNKTTAIEHEWRSDDGNHHQTLHYYDVKGRSIASSVQRLNEDYIRKVLDKREKDLVRYIEWQEARIKHWEPKPLLPLATDVEQQKNAGIDELRSAGARKHPGRRYRSAGWYKGDVYLGRTVKAAVSALKGVRRE